MLYREYPPAAALRDVVSSYWRFVVAPADPPRTVQHVVPPDGTITLCRLPNGMATMVGPRLKALRVPVQSGQEYAGIRFVPGAAGDLLGIDARAWRARTGIWPNDDFSRAARAFAPEALDALVLGWCEAKGWSGLDPVVRELTRRILESEGAAPVSALTSELKLSYRQILRRFFEKTGLTPKEFARVRRIRAACVHTLNRTEPGWAQVAAGTGFADQSHMVREFRDVFGWPPRLVHEYLSQIEHRDVTA